MGDRAPTVAALRVAVRRALRSRVPARLPDGECETRAAVVLVLAAFDAAYDQPEARLLLIRRARVAGDPWSGHVALPGGRAEPGDASLRETAVRELAEETGLRVKEDEFLGRLDERHPRTRRLPSIGITPFVAWPERIGAVVESDEVAGHFWVPLRTLVAPAARETIRQAGIPPRDRPAIVHDGHVIWGLTLAIIEEFAAIIRNLPPGWTT
ncbi:MAG: NUDIX hydrolase [Gemmatimonadota bacterium]